MDTNLFTANALFTNGGNENWVGGQNYFSSLISLVKVKVWAENTAFANLHMHI